MGDMADDAESNYYLSLMHDADFEEERRDRDTYWYQKDGTPIRYEDMSTRHLRNTISMLERNDNTHLKSYGRLCYTLRKREENTPPSLPMDTEVSIKLSEIAPLYRACFKNGNWIGWDNLNNKDVGQSLLNILAKFHGKL